MSKNKISQVQLISIGTCYSLGLVLIAVFESSVTTNEVWLANMLGFVFAIPTLLVFFSLTKKFPGMDIFQMCIEAFGTFIGKIISAIYLLYFLSVCSFSLFNASHFLFYYIMPDTPQIALSAFMMITCVYCVRKGVLPIARVSILFLIVCFLGIGINTALTLIHAHFENLLPIGQHTLLKYVQSAHITSAISYGEMIFLFMLMPNLSEKANPRKVIIWNALNCFLILLLFSVREIVSLGPLMSYTTLPPYEGIRVIEGTNLLSRTESIFALLLVTLTFYKTTILFYISCKGTSDLFGTKTYRHYTLMLGALVVILTEKISRSPIDHIFEGTNVFPFGWTMLSLILPLIIVVTFSIKSAIKRKKGRLSV